MELWGRGWEGGVRLVGDLWATVAQGLWGLGEERASKGDRGGRVLAMGYSLGLMGAGIWRDRGV